MNRLKFASKPKISEETEKISFEELMPVVMSALEDSKKIQDYVNTYLRINLGYISDDMGDPLNKIQESIDSLSSDGVSKKDLEKIVQGMKNSADKLSLILIELKNLGNDKVTLKYDPVNVTDFLNSFKEDVRAKEYMKGIDLEVESNYDGIIQFDEHKIYRILENRVKNSAETFKEKQRDKKIKITTREEDDSVVFEVYDNGPSVQEEPRKNLFDFKKDIFLKENIPGLDLYIVVSTHRGTMYYKSKPEKGTTFYITLPKEPKLPKQPEQTKK